ncbi:unnamed protein product, partial [Phaeothamnion confervicola]
ASVDPGTPLDYVVRFDNGAWLRLDSFSMGLSNSGSIGGSSGAGTGKVSVSDVSLRLGSSAALIDLTHALLSGDQFKTIEIEAYANTGLGKALVDEFRYDNAQLSSLSTNNGIDNSLTFNYDSFVHGHVDQKSKGAGIPSAEGWDFAANQAIAAPALPVADAAKILPADEVSPYDQLTYYVKFGTDGWLKLDGFGLGLQNSSTAGSAGGGAGAGKSSASDVGLRLGSSNELLALTDALNKGTHITNVEIESYLNSGSKGPQLVDEFKFSDVAITSLSSFNATLNALTFDFAQYSHGHVAQDAKGGTTSSVTGWDFATNTASGGPVPTAD